MPNNMMAMTRKSGLNLSKNAAAPTTEKPVATMRRGNQQHAEDAAADATEPMVAHFSCLTACFPRPGR